MQTSIIILTYNSEKYIERLLESIFIFNKGLDYEVIVVDNDSQDETVKVLNHESRIMNYGNKLKLIETGSNLGFAAGINVGAKQAAGEYLLFINPDAEFKSGNISNLVSVFDEKKTAGIVGGKIINIEGKSEFSTGKFFGFFECLLIAFGLDDKFGVRSSPKTLCKVDFVSGGFMMVRSNVFKDLSGFDESFFMYVEDVDLAKRAKKVGFSTYFTPDVAVLHASHGSSNRGFAIKNIYKGIFSYQKKHGNFLTYSIIRVLFLLKAAILVLVGKILNNKSLIDTYKEAMKMV